MKPYPIELRERVARAVDQHHDTLARIAALFSVSVSFITRLLQRRRQTGSLQPKPHGGGRSLVLEAISGWVDSSEAAARKVEQGYDVVGATMKLFCYGEAF